MTPDDENDAIREQVQREFPYPKGGFETEEQLQDWKDNTERRFMELVHNRMTTEEIHDKIQNASIIPTQDTICQVLNIMESMNGSIISLEREVTKLKGQTTPKVVVVGTKWNIWNIPNGLWWKPDGCGYTEDRTQAGIYSYEEALSIMADDLRESPLSYIPKEAMVPAVV